MTAKYEIIYKKEYVTPNPEGFVCLEQYTLVRRGNERSAIIRFFNGLDVRVDRLFFTIEQIDVNGNVITVPENNFAVNVGLDAKVSFEKEIPVNENCVAIKVRIDKVRSGRDEYFLKAGEVERIENVDSMRNMDIPPKLLIPQKEQKRRGQWKLTAIAIVAVVAVLAINVLIAIFSH